MRKWFGLCLGWGSFLLIGGLSFGMDVPDCVIRWKRLSDMPEARRNLKAVVVDGRIYALGGYAQPHEGLEKENFCYDIKTDSWSESTPVPEPVKLAGFTAVEGKLYVIGGCDQEFVAHTFLCAGEIEE